MSDSTSDSEVVVQSASLAFHQRLKALREARGITMREMARRLSVPETTYREWEYGRAIQGEPYPKISEVLGVGLRELLTGETPEKSQVLAELAKIEQHLARLKNEVLTFF